MIESLNALHGYASRLEKMRSPRVIKSHLQTRPAFQDPCEMLVQPRNEVDSHCLLATVPPGEDYETTMRGGFLDALSKALAE